MDAVTDTTEPTEPPALDSIAVPAAPLSERPPANAASLPPIPQDGTPDGSTTATTSEIPLSNGDVHTPLVESETIAALAALEIPTQQTTPPSSTELTPTMATQSPIASNTALDLPDIQSVLVPPASPETQSNNQSSFEPIHVLTPPTSHMADNLPSAASTAVEGQDITSVPPPPLDNNISLLVPPPPADLGNSTNERPAVSIEEDSSSSSSDSDDEEEVRVIRTEDNTEPSADELLVIESGEEQKASDDKHWTAEFFEELPDPEHFVKDSGILEWTVSPVYGTAEAPNKETRLKSPPQRIGGYDWRVVFYPLGLGSDHVSVYIECANPKLPVDSTTVQQVDQAAQDSSSDSDSDAPAPVVDDDGASNSRAWSVPAQFGVIMYNPADDRVMVSRTNHHGFCARAPDWGWPRFYGPHDTIHVRAPHKRRAMLQKDTLCFRAFVRVIHDDTSRLWRFGSDWNSLENTGYRAIGDEGLGRSYIVAAMSCWSLIYPLRTLINSIPTLDPDESFEGPWKPLVAGLQKFFYRQAKQKSSEPVGVTDIVDAFTWYGIELGSQMDVIEFWELLRYKLEGELNTSQKERLGEIFDGQLELRTTNGDGRILEATDLKFAIGKAENTKIAVSEDIEGSFKRVLESYGEAGPAALQNPPKMIQVELNRQIFDLKNRKWQKIVDKVGLSESLDLKKWIKTSHGGSSYWLYALIVHQGDIESGQFFSVLRPDGLGQPWLRFTSERDSNQVYKVTKRDAISGHEGGGGAEENAAVAYAAIYLRKDIVSNYLRGCNGPESPPAWIRTAVEFDDLPESKQTEYLTNKAKSVRKEPIKFKLFFADSFDKLMTLGTFNVFNRELYAKNRAFELTMPWDTKLEALQEKVFAMFGKRIGVSDRRQLSFWMFESDPDSICRPTHPIMDPSLKLGKLRQQSKQIRFWIERIPLDAFDEVEGESPLFPRIEPTTELDLDINGYTWSGRPRKAELPVAEPVAEPVPVPAEPTAPSDAAVAEASLPVTGTIDSMASSAPPAEQAINAEATTTEQTTAEPNVPTTEGEPTIEPEIVVQPPAEAATPASSDTAEAPSQPSRNVTAELNEAEEPSPPVADATAAPATVQAAPVSDEALLSAVLAVAAGQDLVEGSDAPTVTIDEVLDASAMSSQPSESAPAPTPAVELPLPSTEPQSTLPKLLAIERSSFLFYLKEFDARGGRITFLASRLVNKNRTVKDVVDEISKKIGTSAWTLWEEDSLGSLKPLEIKGTFSGQDVFNGAILVIQKTYPDRTQLEVEVSGNYSKASEHFAYLRDRLNNTVPKDGQVSLSYFGKESYIGEYRKGRKHGRGRLQYRNGDFYEGAFIGNKRYGKGRMTFQNGDIYDGDWKEDLMGGQGKMIYAKTGNTYIGGFRQGKRHGKGVMHYLVAEEEQNLCQICYEGEIDALFYDCGHVCSCMECGKQLENCPVCRRVIIRVVKMWKS